MSNSNVKVLITRPEVSGRELQQHLKKLDLKTLGISSYHQPFFDYHAKDSYQQLTQLQQQFIKPIVIFVSVAAVEFAHYLQPISSWQTQCIIAVGGATQRKLNSIGVNAITPIQHDSEGLLALAPLQKVHAKNVLIIRGDGGREKIAEELTNRGAFVHYFESYRRVWRNYPINYLKIWQQQQINCILVTSNALLEFIVNLIKDADTYWKEQCIWLVASNRIAITAKNMGLKRVINANGANKQAISSALCLLALSY